MSHQYPIGSRQYENQRNFLNNNSGNDSTFNVATDQQIYYDSAQSRRPPRFVQRRLTLYQPAPQSQELQQRNSVAYPARGAQLLYAPPSSVISNQSYGDLYDGSYQQQEFVPTTTYSTHPPVNQGMQQQQHVDAPNDYGYEFDEQIYLQDPDAANERLSDDYQQQECFVRQQQQAPLSDYLPDETYARVETYYERSMDFQASRQFEVCQQQRPQHLQVLAQRQFNVVNLPAARRRLSAPLNHTHHQMDSMHHMPQQHQNHRHHYQQQQIQQQRQQHNSTLTISDYFDPPRARASLSDEQVHQHHASALPKQPVQTVMVQGPSLLAPQTYYAQTNDERYDAASAALSSSSLEFIPPPNLPLRNRQDMNMNNGSLATGGARTLPIYAPVDETLDQGSSPVKVSPQMNIPFTSQPYNLQQTKPSSSMLSEANSMITSPKMAAAVLARDPPETNEKPVAPMLSNDAVAVARTHVDNRGIDLLPFDRPDIGSFSGVYDCNSVSGMPAQLATLQHQQSSDRSQQPPSQQHPYANANSSMIATSNGNSQATGSLIKEESLSLSPITDQRILSSPKTNPREYLDMGTSGTVRQDWLDSICGHLIEHMNNFGICVIDDFLGSIKGELILQEVHRLYSNRRYSKGRLVSDRLSDAPDPPTLEDRGDISSPVVHKNNPGIKEPQQSERRLQGTAADATGAIRSDRVIWVDGCEDGCEEINNLIQTLCSVITNSSRLSLYTDNGLDKTNINKRTKAHVACYPGSGTRYIKHVDNPNGDGRVITAIYYLNKNWNTKRDGGLLRMFPAGMDEVANIEPLFDRALFFWSDRRNPHEVLPSFRDRYAITVWYIGETRS